MAAPAREWTRQEHEARRRLALEQNTARQRSDDRWQIGSIGDASLGRLLQEAGQLGAAEVQVVSVPGLNLDFLSIGQGPETMLVPAMDYPELHLARGQRVRANELVPQLVDYAKDFDRKYGEQIRKRKLVM